MSHGHHENPSRADTLYEAFYSGAVGGVVIAVFFLIRDLVASQPFFTPSLLGSAIFLREAASPDVPVRLDMVAYMTLVHLLAFVAMGLIASVVVRRIERWTGGSFALSAMALLVILHGASSYGAAFLPGAKVTLGEGLILMANVLTAVAMTGFLRYAHRTAETGDSDAPREVAERPAA